MRHRTAAARDLSAANRLDDFVNLTLQIADAEKAWNHKNQDSIYPLGGCLWCYVTEAHRRQRGHGEVRNLDQRNATGKLLDILSSY